MHPFIVPAEIRMSVRIDYKMDTTIEHLEEIHGVGTTIQVSPGQFQVYHTLDERLSEWTDTDNIDDCIDIRILHSTLKTERMPDMVYESFELDVQKKPLNDLTAFQKVVATYKSFVKKDAIFNPKTGIWSSDMMGVWYSFCQTALRGSEYGTSVKKQQTIFSLCLTLPDLDGTVCNNRLLYRDCIWNLATSSREDFNHAYYFTQSLPRNRGNPTVYAQVFKILFEDAHDDINIRNELWKSVSVPGTGITLVGAIGTGKKTFTNHVLRSFPGYTGFVTDGRMFEFKNQFPNSDDIDAFLRTHEAIEAMDHIIQDGYNLWKTEGFKRIRELALLKRDFHGQKETFEDIFKNTFKVVAGKHHRLDSVEVYTVFKDLGESEFIIRRKLARMGIENKYERNVEGRIHFFTGIIKKELETLWS